MKKVVTILFLMMFHQTYLIAQNDYSKSVVKPIKLLLSFIKDDASENIKIEIINKHNGTYEMNSLIEKTKGSFFIYTHIKDMTGKESNDFLIFSIDEFTNELNKELDEVSKNKLIIAGNYQEITIKYKGKINKFYTRKAFGLMALFRK